MKILSKLSVCLLLITTTTLVFSQAKTLTCSFCNMSINDKAFMAKSITQADVVKNYDAIECLVNDVKTKDLTDYKSLLVANYNSKELVPAQSAYYLISKSLRSPMGAYLSAYASKEEANKMQATNPGDVLDWSALLLRFKDSKFGDLGHSHHHHDRPDMYGPAGIGGDHLHEKGGAMISVKQMHMTMAGNSELNQEVSKEVIFNSYMMAPEDMVMNMTMVGVMYAPSNNLTLMAMQGFTSNTMRMQMKMMHMGMPPMYTDFETSSKGFGDLKLQALVGLISKPNTSFHGNIGLSIPVGSVTATDDTPMAENAKLPYAMQIGSGTWDATLGATYRGNTDQVSWGVQQLNVIRTGKNSEAYHMGNNYSINSWMAVSLNHSISTSFRMTGIYFDPIQGADPELNPMMSPTAKGIHYERQVVRGYLGVNALLWHNTILIGGEFGLNVWQRNPNVFMQEKQFINGSLKYII